MPQFRYKAFNKTGGMVEGEMEAIDQRAVIAHLQNLDCLPVSAERIDGSMTGWLRRDLTIAGGVGRRDAALITRELATLLGAGLPLDRSLEIIAGLADREPVRSLLEEMLEKVRGGMPLSEAMASRERVFPRYYVSTIRAGEAGGSLEVVLDRLADLMEHSLALAGQIRSALAYPAIVLVMAGVVTAILLVVVIPEFTPLFEDAGDALPLSTQILIGIGEAVRQWWWLMLIALIALVLGLRRQLARPPFRRRWDRWLLKAPYLGDLIVKVEITRFSRTLSTLLANGVPLLASLAIVRESVGNMAVADVVDELALSAREGKGLTAPLIRSDVFPSLATQLIHVGEETGQLESMLAKIADIYRREVGEAIDRLLAVLVPAVTVCLGLVVAAIVMSLFSAILAVYDLPF